MFDVITIGTATRDIFLKSKSFKAFKDIHFESGKSIAFELGTKTEVEELFYETGGGATNAAVSLARLGLKTAACFEVGKDLAGKDIVRTIKKNKISSNLIRIDSKNHTSVSIIFLTPEGERNIFVHRGSLIDEKEINLKKLKSKWLYVSSVGGNIKLLNKIARFVEKKDINLALNPGSKELKLGLKKLSRVFNATDVLILNRNEASSLMGISYNFKKTIFRKACGLTPGIEVITDGRAGAYATDDERGYRVGIYDWEITDRLGAGDAFGSGFVGAYIKYNQNIEKALQYASFNASSVVTKIGAKAGIVNHFPAKPLRVKVENMLCKTKSS